MPDEAMMTTLLGALGGTEPPAAEVPPVTTEEPVAAPVAEEAEPAAPVEEPVAEPPVEEALEETEPETPEALLKGVIDPNSSRGKQIWDGYRFTKSLAEPPKEDGTGGIGHIPTVDDIKTYHLDHITLGQMLDEFETNPAAMIAGLSNVNMEATVQLIQELPSVLDQLSQNSPQIAKAYEGLYTKVVDDLVNGFLAQYRSAEDPDTKKWYFATARNIRYFVTNGQKQLTEAEAMGRKPEVDPYAEERARIEAEKKTLRDQALAREENIWKGFRGATFKELDKAMEQACAWPKELKEQLGRAAEPTLRDAENRVYNAVKGSPVAQQELSLLFKRAQRAIATGGNLDAYKAQIVKTYMKYAAPVVAKVRAETLKDFSFKATTSQPTKKAATGTPAKAATTVPSPSTPKRQKGETYDDFAMRTIGNALGIQ